MPRKTRTPLLSSLRRFEERRERAQVLLAARVEMGHRRTGVDAARALEVADLELDPLVLGAFAREVGRAELGAAGAEVRMAVQAAGLGEQLRSRDRFRI